MSLKRVKERLENLKCPIHGQSPEIKISMDVLSFKCCCIEFEKTVKDKAKFFIEDETVNDINNIFKM